MYNRDIPFKFNICSILCPKKEYPYRIISCLDLSFIYPSIAYRLRHPPLCMMPDADGVFWNPVFQHDGNFPKVFDPVVCADCKLWSLAFDQLFSTLQRCFFCPFNIHFQEGYPPVPQHIIQADSVCLDDVLGLKMLKLSEEAIFP